MLENNETARILADSYNLNTHTRFTTFLIKLPKYLLAQLNTHRNLSRNCASSRAIPAGKMIDSVIQNPVREEFSANKPGMQGAENSFSNKELEDISAAWDYARLNAIDSASELAELKVHKQHVNRLLEPFMQVEVLISGTEWQNFFELRTSRESQPGIRKVAVEMLNLYNSNKPKRIMPGSWHIPFSDFIDESLPLETKLKIAVARCARLSYSCHDGEFSVEKDVALYNQLLESKHLSCFEHMAIAIPSIETKLPYDEINKFSNSIKKFLFVRDTYEGYVIEFSRQYAGFYTYRSMLEDNTQLDYI